MVSCAAMKQRRTFAGLILAVCLGLGVAVPVGAWPSAPYPRGPAAPAMPPLTAKAALVRENTVNMTLVAREAETPLPPASTIKMLTALTALAIGDLNDVITAQKGDLVGGSMMGLQAGDSLSLGELMKGLLIPSGNDAAMAIARAEGAKLPEAATVGPVPAFVAKMNAIAAERGLVATRAANPSGLDAPGATTTARDLARLAELVLAEPTLAQIVRTPEATITSAFGSYTVKSTNQLLGTPGVIGVKTGTEESIGQNLVLAVNEGEHRLILVVIGSQDRYADARALLGYARAAWSWVTLGDPQAIPGLARALDAWSVTINERKPLVLDRGVASALRYTLLIGQAGAPPPPAPPATPAARPTGTPTPTATGPPRPPGARGVIIYLLGDRELARMDLVAVGASPAATPRP